VPVLLFNLAMVVVDVAVLRRLRSRRSAGELLLGFSSACLAVVLLAGIGEELASRFTLYGHLFTFLGLVAWGVFVHLTVLLIGGAVVLWQESRVLSRLLVLGALGSMLFSAYAFGIEPSWLEVTRYRIHSPKLTRPYRIVVLADLQTDEIGGFEARVIRAVAAEEPDILILPGDFLHIDGDAPYLELSRELNALLREEGLEASLGIYASRGNVDHDSWPRIFDGLDVHAFTESGHVEVAGLHLSALDLEDSFDPRTSIPAREGFHVVFGHGPDYALGDVQADLLLAGHTHGGQVRIPGFGPPLTLSRVPRAWAAGRTELPGGRTLIVSRGIGMERGYAPRIRFLCRPELVVIDLLPAG
jgi:predicted MPP superfamily phosphohydrolase